MAEKSDFDRRRFLALAGGGTLATALAVAGASSGPVWATPRFREDPFALGVASGEPTSSGVVLWTRLAPDPVAEDGTGGMPGKAVNVAWQIAEDPRFRRVVRAGTQQASPELAHSVHVEAEGLRPDREYWYRFRAGGELSPVGRTRTAPWAGAALSSLAFGVVSCQSYPDGYYTAYRHLAEEDLDLVLHLGDYIYEGGGQGSIGRGHLPAAETFSLTDYRIRYGQYKSDTDLKAAHAAAPWLVVLDDHEVENNWAGDVSQADTEPDQDPAVFLQRRAAAFQAYYENQPLRRVQRPHGPDMRLHRRVPYGRLAEFTMVDTRQYRDDQACGDGLRSGCADRLDPTRTMLGEEQEAWVLRGLERSRATWNLLGNQVFMMQADHLDGEERGFGMDTWDGYAAARRDLLDGVRRRKVDNFVVLTGDAHRSVAADLKVDFDDPDAPAVGTEFLGTSVSSGGNGQDMDTLGHTWLRENPHMRFHNAQRGYMRCELTPGRLRTDYRVLGQVTTPGAPVTTRASVYVEAGRPGVAHVED
ncbi:alkaline phosphatase D family protein [Prauserella endophytica]|uniref:Alkaline phosphatase n=1 Tax=Prauserella endophytica TaxID=1592324 RepID=A0ABY2RVR8_9PSEU|nr:alkaline phosphatase D family protein [Prauserella endophytica]TKG62586.1 alkaline phosphatase [Prauserella endophytica]